MSTTTTPMPANPQPAASTGFFNAVITGIEHGANTVYHRLLAIESSVTKWEADNPLVVPFINEGLAFTKSFVSRMGVPVDAVALVGEDTLAALKALAAADPTVQSGDLKP